MEDEQAKEQADAKQRCREMCSGADEQAYSGGEKEDAGGDGERAADGIPGRPDEREDEEILQAKTGEGEGENHAGAADGAVHSVWERGEIMALGGMIRESSGG
jgi:hypothetical protein